MVAMAAYRAGVVLKDERRGVDLDYRRRRGVVHAEIMAPDGVPAWLHDREALWNAVEKMEIRKDAQLAREINMALPHELTDAERLALVRSFIREQFVSLGMVADFAIHAPVPEKRDDPRNHHVHVLLTLRQAGGGGLRRVKTREWNSDAMLIGWRRAWADVQNKALGRGAHPARVDHRSLEAQRAEAVRLGRRREAAVLLREPEVHVGPKAKKAAVARPPTSKVRNVGPRRRTKKAGRTVPMRRTVRYPDFDRGSRVRWTMQRLSRNARSYERAIARAERQMTRLRQRRAYYVKAANHKAPRDARKRTGGEAARRAHALKRLAEIAYWINELDLLFFSLLGIRESQLVRRTVWSNRLTARRLRGLALGRPWMPG